MAMPQTAVHPESTLASVSTSAAASAPPWLSALRQASRQAPLQPRWPLWCNGQRIGSVAHGVLEAVDAAGCVQAAGAALQHHASGPLAGWQLTAPDAAVATAALNALARGLRAANCCGPWRNEQLDVRASDEQWLATVERGAVRVLGVGTRAVHLLGSAPDGRMWVQQRALDKPTHPGKWDTLMGGMVSSGDSLQAALARETREEAGLELAPLQQLRHGGHVDFACPSEEGGDGVGYMQERIDWFHAVLPEGVLPQNMDGEVAQFLCIDMAQLRQWLEQERFTPEASWILGEYLGL